MGMHEPANGSDTLAARRLVETKQQPQNNRGAQRSYSEAASFKRLSPTPMELSSLKHMRPVEDEIERGRTLKRKRRFDSGCSISRGRERRRIDNIRQWSSDQSDEESDEIEEYPGNDIWKNFLQETIMADLRNAPVIPPPASRSASNSPIRKQILQLKSCKPPVMFVSERSIESGPIMDLRYLLRDAGDMFLNEEMRSRLHGRDSRDTRNVRRLDDDDFEDAYGKVDVDRLFNAVKSIEDDAEMCEMRLSDEAEWTHVAKAVLKTALEFETAFTEDCGVLQVLDIRTQGVRPQFLPTVAKDADSNGPRVTVPSKKTDLTLAWNEFMEPAKQFALGQSPINQFSHASSEMRPLQCAVEVKATTAPGATDEARLQLALCQAGALSHLYQYTKGIRAADDTTMEDVELPVQVGWVVCGHRWELYMSHWDPKAKSVTFAGPLGRMVLGTDSRIAVLQLIAVLRRLARWLVTDYWKHFSSLLTAPAN